MQATLSPIQRALMHCHQLNATYPCKRGTIIIISPGKLTATIVPLCCKKWSCPWCGPRRRRLWATRIATGKPERFITLTTDPKRFASPRDATAHLKKALPRLIQALRRQGRRFEYALVWELTEEGWPHIHIAQRGDYIPQPVLRSLWDRLGCGTIVDVRKIDSTAKAANYVAKYLAKTTSQDPDTFAGLRIIQCSLHWRDYERIARATEPECKPIYIPCKAPPARVLELLTIELGLPLALDASPGNLILEIPLTGWTEDDWIDLERRVRALTRDDLFYGSLSSMGQGLTPQRRATPPPQWYDCDAAASF